jgi:hypothetical protein
MIAFAALFLAGVALVVHAVFRVVYALCRALFEPGEGGAE